MLAALNALQQKIIAAAAAHIIQEGQRRQHIRQNLLRYRHSLILSSVALHLL